MAKNFSCWVIVAGALPTAFRSKNADDLIPTLRQLQRTQPDAQLKWFERGRFWDSPAAAQAASRGRRPPGRGRDWRPGGDHADPRAKYQISRDEKRARFKQRLIGDRVRSTRPDDGSGPPKDGRRGDRPPGDRPKPNWGSGDRRPPGRWPGNRDRSNSGWGPSRDFRGPRPEGRGDPRRPDNRGRDDRGQGRGPGGPPQGHGDSRGRSDRRGPWRPDGSGSSGRGPGGSGGGWRGPRGQGPRSGSGDGRPQGDSGRGKPPRGDGQGRPGRPGPGGKPPGRRPGQNPFNRGPKKRR
jgi:hypothetical protein